MGTGFHPVSALPRWSVGEMQEKPLVLRYRTAVGYKA